MNIFLVEWLLGYSQKVVDWIYISILYRYGYIDIHVYMRNYITFEKTIYKTNPVTFHMQFVGPHKYVKIFWNLTKCQQKSCAFGWQ